MEISSDTLPIPPTSGIHVVVFAPDYIFFLVCVDPLLPRFFGRPILGQLISFPLQTLYSALRQTFQKFSIPSSGFLMNKVAHLLNRFTISQTWTITSATGVAAATSNRN
jgi:hypothetical protein